MKASKRSLLMTFALSVAIVGILTFMLQTPSRGASATRSRIGMVNSVFDPQWTSLQDGSLTSDLGPREAAKSERPGKPEEATEAPTGFDNLTNGYLDQGPAFQDLNENTVVPLRSFNDNRFIFEEVETIEDGLGPTHNAQSCRECHQNVVTGGGSQITELRSGRLVRGKFFNSMGGTLIQSRATHPEIVEHKGDKDNVSTFRLSLSTLGDGFIECIANDTLLAIRDAQPVGMRGDAVMVPVIESKNETRVGRFGWKSQHASLVSFSADAYLNEMGITTPFPQFSEENPSNGTFVGFGSRYDPVPDPEDDGEDVAAFAGFMRSTKAPSRGKVTAEVISGEKLFAQIGCTTCHVSSIVTAPPDTMINAGAFQVPEALGNKIVHPYSDFLLHNIGTGDGIPIQPIPEYAFTANKIRTAPLWGLRTRNRLMHDGLSFTSEDAILRHGGQAAGVASQFNKLSRTDRKKILAFLESL